MSSVRAMEFATWAMALGRTPTPDEIMARYPDVHRSTAYRWRDMLLQAWGIEATGDYLVTHPAPKVAP